MTGPSAPRSRSPSWKTPPPCGWRWAPAPRPWPASRPPGSTQRRKRSVFYNALGYAVELGRLGSNPVDRIQWTAPAVAPERGTGGSSSAPPRPGRSWTKSGGWGSGEQHLEYVLRRPLLRGAASVGGGHAPRGRPAPAEGRVGRIVLAASASRAGRAWTDEGTARQERGLKHRADNETRTIPHPAGPGPAAARPHQAVRHDPGRADLPDRPGRHPAGLRLQRGLERGPQGSAHPGPVPVAARSASV